MNVTTFTNIIGSADGYEIDSTRFIPSASLEAIDHTLLGAVTDIDTDTLPNGMAAIDQYGDLIVDPNEYVYSLNAPVTQRIVGSDHIAPANEITMTFDPHRGAITEVYPVFLDASGNPINTGSGTVEVFITYMSGYEKSIGTVNAATPEALTVAPTLCTQVRIVPNTLSGIDTHMTLVTQERDYVS